MDDSIRGRSVDRRRGTRFKMQLPLSITRAGFKPVRLAGFTLDIRFPWRAVRMQAPPGRGWFQRIPDPVAWPRGAGREPPVYWESPPRRSDEFGPGPGTPEISCGRDSKAILVRASLRHLQARDLAAGRLVDSDHPVRREKAPR